MSFDNALADIANRTQDYADSLETEEATKTAIIMPFIQGVLGYDVFNPAEVIPEFVADVGSRKGEKIDYAIKQDGKIQILIEAKKIGEPLSLEHASQLVRYFSVSNDARIGILTNGRYWHFYTDLDKPNIMDSRPFLRLDLMNIDPYALPELKKLTKSTFDLGSVLTAAEELKYVSSTRSEIARAFNDPDPDFVQLFARRVYDGALTARMRDFFQNVVEKACRQFLAEQVNERLKNALSESSPLSSNSPDPDSTERDDKPCSDAKPGIITTDEEREAYFIVRAIVASEIPVDRIFERDTKSYFTVLVDDSNRKPVCRFHFNGKNKKYLGIIGPDKSETRHLLERLEDIYEHAEALRETVKRYA